MEYFDKCEHSSDSEEELDPPPSPSDELFIDDTLIEEEELCFNITKSPSKISLPCYGQTSPDKKKQRLDNLLPEELGSLPVSQLDTQDLSDISFDVLLSRMSSKYIEFSSWTKVVKSDLTQINVWLIAGLEMEPHAKGRAIFEHCRGNAFIRYLYSDSFFVFCLEFINCRKSRKGLKSLCSKFGLETFIVEPPNNRSTATATDIRLNLHNLNKEDGHGPEMPWIKTVSMSAKDEKFDFSSMVQWAMQNNYTSQAVISYQYCLLASEGDNNAKQWLASTSQVKYAKDCVTQVNLLMKGELMCSTTNQIIEKNVRAFQKKEKGNPVRFTRWLTLQRILQEDFLGALKTLIAGKMKKSCVCLWGVPNSGKSTLVNYLLQIFEGKFLSFTPQPSSFWLQPAAGLKLVAIDDVPFSFWEYADHHLRPMLDGTQITIDVKYQAPLTTRMPPILLTTNLNIPDDKSMTYLKNRIRFISCQYSMLESNRLKTLSFTLQDLCAWFEKFSEILDLNFDDGTASEED